LFFKLEGSRDGKIVTTPGVLRVLSFGGAWGEVDQSEIDAIRTISERKKLRFSCPCPRVGTWVRVASGPFKGIKGQVIDPSRRVVVVVPLIQRAVAVTFDENTVLVPLSVDVSARAAC